MAGQWIQWTAWNRETLFGWSEGDDITEAATAWLNRNSETHLYAPSPVDLVEIGRYLLLQELEPGENVSDDILKELANERLQEKSGLVCDADTTVEEFTIEA